MSGVTRRPVLRGDIVVRLVVVGGVVSAPLRGRVVVAAFVLPGRLRHRAARVTLGAVPHRDRSHAAQRQGDERHEQDQGFEPNGHFVRVCTTSDAILNLPPSKSSILYRTVMLPIILASKCPGIRQP